MKKFNLTIDVDRINLENENHIRNFSQKIKNLAQHCVNYINSIEDKTDCNNKRFLPEIHDDDNDSTFDTQCSFPLPQNIHQKRQINFDFFNIDNPLMIPS